MALVVFSISCTLGVICKSSNIGYFYMLTFKFLLFSIPSDSPTVEPIKIEKVATAQRKQPAKPTWVNHVAAPVIAFGIYLLCVTCESIHNQSKLKTSTVDVGAASKYNLTSGSAEYAQECEQNSLDHIPGPTKIGSNTNESQAAHTPLDANPAHHLHQTKDIVALAIKIGSDGANRSISLDGANNIPGMGAQSSTSPRAAAAALDIIIVSKLLHDRQSSTTESLLKTFDERLKILQTNLDNVLESQQTQQAEQTRMHLLIVKLQEAGTNFLGDSYDNHTGFTPRPRKIDPWANQRYCDKSCSGHTSGFFCNVGCSMYKMDKCLIVMNLTDRITPCVAPRLSDARSAVRECFRNKQDTFLRGVADRFGLTVNATQVNGVDIDKCEGFNCAVQLSSPDTECAVVRLNAFLKVLSTKKIKPCASWLIPLDQAIQECVMHKIDVLIDSINLLTSG